MSTNFRPRRLIAVGIFIAVFATFLPHGGAAEFRTDIEYGQAGGESLKLDVSIPERNGLFPVAVLIHGGGWGGGDKTHIHVPPSKPLTDEFTWFSIDYRLAPRYRWPACVDDVRTAICWVKEHATEFKGDPERIALVGYSAGGHLAAFAAATGENGTRVDAVVLLAAPTDLESDCERRGQVSPALQALLDRGPELDDNARSVLRDASPLNYLTTESPPTLLVHGAVDESVPYSQSVNYREQLAKLGVPCELITIPGGTHKLAEWKSLDPAYEAKMVDWLKRALSRRH